MRHESDDDLYRVRIKFLGPPGWTLPIHFTYPQIGVFALIAAILEGTGSVIFDGKWFVGPFIALALGATWVLFRFVDADVPVRHVIKAAVADCQRLEPAAADVDTRLPVLTGRNITITREI